MPKEKLIDLARFVNRHTGPKLQVINSEEFAGPVAQIRQAAADAIDGKGPSNANELIAKAFSTGRLVLLPSTTQTAADDNLPS